MNFCTKILKQLILLNFWAKLKKDTFFKWIKMNFLAKILKMSFLLNFWAKIQIFIKTLKENYWDIFDHSGFIRDLWSSLTESRVTKWPQDLLVFQLRAAREMETWCKTIFFFQNLRCTFKRSLKTRVNKRRGKVNIEIIDFQVKKSRIEKSDWFFSPIVF